MLLKSGRFGPICAAGRRRRAEALVACPRAGTPDALTLERALELLTLPRDVGDHPETGKPITAGIGRYGPFVLHDGSYANLPDVEEVFSVGLNRAVDLLAAKAAGWRTARRRHAGGDQDASSTPMAPSRVRDGRYGPYVNQGKVNATLPKALKPEDVTLEQALELIAARAAVTGSKGGRGRKAAPKKAAAAKAPAKPRRRNPQPRNPQPSRLQPNPRPARPPR